MLMSKQRGVSLIEILIGIAITIVIAVAVLGIFTNTFDASERVLQQGKLDRDLYSIVNIIVADVQRAGYWSAATNSGATNPFMTGTNDISANLSNNCITFTYDNGPTNATDNTVDDTDRFGYGLQDGAIKFRQAGSSFSCTSMSGWENLSDTNAITITGFTVTTTNQPVDIDGTDSGTDTINYRTVTITVTGALRNNTNNAKTITRTIKVYNNKYIP